MIEETHPNDDSYIVRVKAVVMTRDESSGGWLAQDGGALSRVGVCRVLPPELSPAGRTQFLIHGERLLDKQVILECQLRKDLVYTKPTPTFHHWKVEERKFGLTFQSPADARAFDRGVRKAVEDMTEGSTTSSSTLQNEAELGDDDVFTNATDSSSNSSQRLETSLQQLESSPYPHRHNRILGHRHDLHDPNRLSDHYFPDQSLSRLPRHVTFQEEEEIVRINPRERIWEHTEEYHPGHHLDHSWLTGYEDYRHANVRDKFIQPDDSESYVHFAKSEPHKHDYTYPLAPAELLDSDSDPSLRPFANKDDSSHHHVSSVVSSQPRSLLPGSAPGDKGRKVAGDRQRLRCRYCGELFFRSDNRRGQCQDAPDPIRACVHRASCMWLADTMLYHCMSDPEGDYSDPCSCEGADGDEGDGGQLGPRWAALLGLSLVAPCLCLYPPLHACHWVGVACGCCGGRHKATG